MSCRAPVAGLVAQPDTRPAASAAASGRRDGLIVFRAPLAVFTTPRYVSALVLERAVGARLTVHQNPYNSRSEEHTSELQSRFDLVCRLLLEKKKKTIIQRINFTFLTTQHSNLIIFLST